MARELYHNTEAQVVELITFAAALVEQLDLPEDLRGVAFAKAVDLKASKQVFIDQAETQSPIARGLGIPPMTRRTK